MLTEDMRIVAEKEHVKTEFIMEGLAKGTIIIPKNVNRPQLSPIGIGKGLTTKINANIGSSKTGQQWRKSLRKYTWLRNTEQTQ